MKRLLTLLPTIESVRKGESILGKDNEGQKIFLSIYQNDMVYIRGTERAREIVDSFSESGKMKPKDRKELA